jgi:hypothetical protein
MRWLVEVTALGKTDKESLHVEAESWQKALQAARAQRGDTAPMSGFSIELLDDGCRAVDPMSRLRYQVRKAPEDAPGAKSQPPKPASQPTAAAAAPAPTTPSATVATAPAAPSPPAAPAAAPHAPAAPAAPAVAAKKPAAAAASPAARTMLMGSGAAPHPPTPGAQPHAPPPGPVVHPAPVVAVGPVAPAAPHAPAAARADVAATVVPSQIIFKREQDATDAMPLTYREYVYLVPPGTTEAAAETLLATQLELVKTSLERVQAGKLVNLGVFDVAFQGRPPVPPLATVQWKDWRGAPVIAFPRRPGYVAAPAPVAHIAPAVPAHPVVPVAPNVQHVAPVAPVAAPVHHPVVPVAAPAPVAPAHVAPPAPVVAPPAPVVAPAPVVFPPPPAPAIVAPAPVIAAAPVVPPAPAPVAPAPVVAPHRPPSAGNLNAAPRGRLRSEDLIADLFEAMHDLHFVRDAVEGGDFCLALAMEKLPSQFGIVHLYDIDKREFLVTNVRGAGTSKLLMRRHPENDAVLLAAMRNRVALVIADAAQSDAAALERYALIGGARSIIVAPVLQHGRFLGAIEILNPLDGQPFTEHEGSSLSYIAEQFAEYISSHGIVTDPERINARQLPEA